MTARRLLRGLFIGTVAAINFPVYAVESHVPALLQFAEQYQNPHPVLEKPGHENNAQTKAGSTRTSNGAAVKADPNDLTLRLSLRDKDSRLRGQQNEIQALQNQLTALREKPPQKVVVEPTPDITVGIAQLIQGVKKGLQPLPEQQKMAELINTARQESTEAQAEVLTARQNTEALRKQLDQKDNSLAQLTHEVQKLKEQLTAPEPEVKIASDQQKQSYSAGVALGKNVLEVQAEQASIGVTTDKKLLLAGIQDAFSGNYKMQPDALASALHDSDVQIAKAREKNSAQQKSISEGYLAQFIKKKGTHKSDAGFWYHIDYIGDNKIPNGSIYQVVVQESLTDGTVIQDMEVNGSVLSQTLDKYPPIFREALSKLHNHGTITLVVPPELAYGERGYPPKIPPNATMVYVVRIVDAGPAS